MPFILFSLPISEQWSRKTRLYSATLIECSNFSLRWVATGIGITARILFSLHITAPSLGGLFIESKSFSSSTFSAFFAVCLFVYLSEAASECVKSTNYKLTICALTGVIIRKQFARRRKQEEGINLAPSFATQLDRPIAQCLVNHGSDQVWFARQTTLTL